MAANPIVQFLQRFPRSALLREGEEQTDSQLLERFVGRQDRVALETLVRRHAPMVWDICRRTLANHHEAEDAFQATYLVLVRKAASIRSRELLANWLYRVAYQTARKARQRAAKRYSREKQVETMPQPQTEPRDDAFGPELRALLDEELGRLPEKYRLAVVLCDLQGRSRPDVARQLRLPEGTVGSRLARGRALLARRLARRGLTVSATTLAAVWSQQAASGAVPASLLTKTIEAAWSLAAGETAAAGLVSTEVSPFAEGGLLVSPAALGVALLWAFWPTLTELAHRWSTDPQYSHGYLVPAVAAALLYMRCSMCVQLVPGFRWGGLALLTLGLGVRFAGEYLYIDWLDAAALLPCLAGLAVFLGGKPALRWAWPAIAFLVFMVPMPFSIQNAMPHPLQRVATLASTCALRALGQPALAEGNIICLGETRVGVVEACSGLSMLVIFFALSTAVALMIDRPLWKKLMLVAWAVPIALVANSARITVTVILHERVGHKAADLVFHDLAGWLMMPFALILLWLELKVLALRSAEVKPVAAMVVIPTGVSRAMAAYKSKNRR